MASSRYAVIDLGSNTFHLLISDLDHQTQSFKEVFRKRSFVYLSKDGIQQLSNKAISRAVNCLKLMGALCRAYEVDEIEIFGTAVFRSASNIELITEAIANYCGTTLRILTGEEEADYILKGISWTIESDEQPYLVMDIGGGSVEYILVDGDNVSRCSLNHGISVLRNEWERSDPPSDSNLVELYNQLDREFIEKEAYQLHQPVFLVGSSGPFEILESMLGQAICSRDQALPCIRKILSASLDERMSMDKVPEVRADLSMESMALVDNALRVFKTIESIRVSPFGIKEGFIREKLNLD